MVCLNVHRQLLGFSPSYFPKVTSTQHESRTRHIEEEEVQPQRTGRQHHWCLGECFTTLFKKKNQEQAHLGGNPIELISGEVTISPHLTENLREKAADSFLLMSFVTHFSPQESSRVHTWFPSYFHPWNHCLRWVLPRHSAWPQEASGMSRDLNQNSAVSLP